MKLFYLSVIFFSLLSVGCATNIKSSQTTSATGYHYALPLSQLQVSVKETITYPNDAKFYSEAIVPIPTEYRSVPVKDLSDEAREKIMQLVIENCYSKGKASTKHELTNFNTDIVADWSKQQSISIDPQVFSSGKLTIERYSNGMLKSIDFNTTGKAGEVLKTTLALAGTIAGYASGTPIAVGTSSEKEDSNRPESSELHNLGPDSTNIGESCEEERARLFLALQIEDFVTEKSSNILQIAVFRGLLTLKTFQQSKEIKNKLETFDEKLLNLAVQLQAATQEAEITKTQAEIKRVSQAKTMLQHRANSITALQTKHIEALKKEFSVKQKEVTTKTYYPNIEDLTVNPTNDGNLSDVDKRKIEKVFANLFVAVTLQRLKAVKRAETKNDNDCEKSECECECEVNNPEFENHIAYRDPELFRVTYWKKNEISNGGSDSGSVSNSNTENTLAPPEKKYQWAQAKSEIHTLFSSKSPIAYLEYQSSAWGNRAMTLDFQANGMLTTVNYTYDASAENFINGLNEGTTNYINKLKEAQTAKFEINKSRRDEQLAVVDFQQQQLVKEKALIEAQYELGLATQESTVQLNELEQQIALLEQQKNLINAQTEFDIAEQTSTSGLDAKILEADLAKLKAQQALNNQVSGGDAVANQTQTMLSLIQLQNQLADEDDQSKISDLNKQINELEITLKVLLKELEFRGIVNTEK